METRRFVFVTNVDEIGTPHFMLAYKIQGQLAFSI
jgi:hypothetical protein